MSSNSSNELAPDWRERLPELVDQFVKRWEEVWEQRHIDLSPEELCPNGPPELLAAIRADIGRLKRFPLPPPHPRPGGQGADPADSKEIGGEFVTDKYVGIRCISIGGQGTVVLARDVDLDREVAIKHVAQRTRHRPEAPEQLQREARIASNLEHPGVIPIYGFGQDAEGNAYYAMRYLPKERTFEDVIRDTHQETDASARDTRIKKALQEFVTICRTMAYAHRKGVIHGDIKPTNVVVGNFGEVFVVDWGLAKDLSSATSSDATDESSTPQRLSGTLSYMSPEQAAGGETNECSDIYSLGATLYQLLTGEPPYDGESVPEILAKVQSGKFAQPREVNPGIPHALEAICLKAMAEEPRTRYESSNALGDDVESWLYDRSVAAWPAPLYERTRRWIKHHQRTASSAVAAMLVAVVILSIAAAMLNAARQRVIAANERLAGSLYRNQFLYAASVLREGDTTAAVEILDSCDPSQRDIEWSYLRALLGTPRELAFPRLAQASVFAVSRDAARIAIGGETPLRFEPRAPGKVAETTVVAEASRQRNEVIVADPATGQIERVFQFGQVPPSEVFLSPDGRQIAFTGALGPDRQRSAQVYSVDTGNLVWRQDSTEDRRVYFVAFGNEHDFFTTSGLPEAARDTWELQRWSATSGDALEPLVNRDPRSSRKGVRPTAEGDALEVYRVFDDTVVRMLDLQPAEGSFGGQSAVSADGPVAVAVRARNLAGADEFRALVWLDEEDPTWSWYLVADAPVKALAFSRDDSLLAVADERSIQVWDTRTQCLRFKAANRAKDTTAVALLTNDTVAVADWQGAVWSWNIDTSAVKSLGANFNAPIHAALAGENGTRLITVDEHCTVQCWDLERNALQAEFHLLLSHELNHTRGIAVGRTNSMLALEHREGVALVDTATGDVVREFADLRGPVAMVLGDSGVLAFRNLDTSQETLRYPVVVDIADVESPTFGTTHSAFLLPPEEPITSVVANASGTLTAAAAGDKVIVQPLRLAIESKGRWKATLSEHEQSFLEPRNDAIGLRSLEPVVLRSPAGQPLTPLAFSPGSRQLVTAVAGDNTIRIFDTATWEHVVLTGHSASVTGAIYSPNGKRLYTAAEDGTIRIWDPDRRTLLWTMRDAHAPVTGIGYSVGTSNLVGVTFRQDTMWRGDRIVDILLWRSNPTVD